jgi:hypothetical protein
MRPSGRPCQSHTYQHLKLIIVNNNFYFSMSLKDVMVFAFLSRSFFTRPDSLCYELDTARSSEMILGLMRISNQADPRPGRESRSSFMAHAKAKTHEAMDFLAALHSVRR